MINTVLATKSIIPDLQAPLAEPAYVDSAAYQANIEVLVRLAVDPAIHGMANHLLYVGRKA
jgi:hypothetical protein